MLTNADIARLKEVFATKENLKVFATKEDLKVFATKENLKVFSTKQELKATTNDLVELILAFRQEFKQEMGEFRAEMRGLRVELRNILGNHERRINNLEEEVYS